jgi:nitroimidazol reductase NimA-like FMN-containing flavoprotein (pyridoxamine 5'-phosphate oxidase superfamily)
MSSATELPSLEDLPRDECLRLLRSQGIGRLAVATPGTSPLVVPVNYLVDGDEVVFRSGAGSKLRALRGAPVSFEVDEFDTLRRTGWSVLVRGSAYETTHWEIEHLPVEPWAPGDKAHWIRIVPDAVSGRRITLPDLSVDLGGHL